MNIYKIITNITKKSLSMVLFVSCLFGQNSSFLTSENHINTEDQIERKAKQNTFSQLFFHDKTMMKDYANTTSAMWIYKDSGIHNAQENKHLDAIKNFQETLRCLDLLSEQLHIAYQKSGNVEDIITEKTDLIKIKRDICRLISNTSIAFGKSLIRQESFVAQKSGLKHIIDIAGRNPSYIFSGIDEKMKTEAIKTLRGACISIMMSINHYFENFYPPEIRYLKRACSKFLKQTDLHVCDYFPTKSLELFKTKIYNISDENLQNIDSEISSRQKFIYQP